jgi:hypothetical protein
MGPAGLRVGSRLVRTIVHLERAHFTEGVRRVLSKETSDRVQPGLRAAGPGVYIIYDCRGAPFYVGRSRVDIHHRLWCHATKNGSRKVRDALNRNDRLTFEWQEMLSPEQAEAQLISALGVMAAGNLRQETDPADW